MLIAHVEREGVWALAGGMHALPKVLAEQIVLREPPCVTSHLVDASWSGMDARSGVMLEGGETLDADAVVFNGDANALAQGFLGEAAQSSLPPFGRDKRYFVRSDLVGQGRRQGLSADQTRCFSTTTTPVNSNTSSSSGACL